MKMSKLAGGVVCIVATVLPSFAFSQANISRPRTGSPVIPGGAAIPGGQSVPRPDPADPTPDAVPGLELIAPDDRERRADAAARAAEATAPPLQAEPGSVPVATSGGDQLQNLVVSQLQITSLASIELNQFAAERVAGSDVREFAETLVSDQQHFWRALERLHDSQANLDGPPQRGGVGATAAPSNETFGRPSLTAAERVNPTQLGITLPIERQLGQSPLGQTLPDQFPLSRRPPTQSLNPGADAGIRYGGTLPPAGGETRVPEAEVPTGSVALPVTRNARPAMSVGETLPTAQWITIADRAAQAQLAITKELLARNEGEQFDKRFVIMQLAERIHFLARLQALKDIGSDQFREIIQTAEELTQGHLASAEALSNR